VWLESEGLGKGTTCKMYIAVGIPGSAKPKRISPRLDLHTLSDVKNLKVYFQSLQSVIFYLLDC
jgi:hypothetical protein